jgi:membrane fusion protein, heavy metal efflux system
MQIGLVVATAVALILLLVAVPSALRAAGSRAAPEPAPPPPGTFRATGEQWRALAFAQAQPTSFADLVSTDGKIAQDDDVTVQVTPPFSGRVVAVAVKAGDRVAKGQTLLTAEATDVAQARNDLVAAQTALATAMAQNTTAQANSQRQQALFKISGAALRDVQQASSDAAAAADAVKADEAALALVKSRLAVLQASTGAGALAVVKAPVSGVVLSRQVGPGQYLNATSNGATAPIFTVGDTSRVWLSANVREEDASRIHLGERVQVHVAGLPGRTFEGRVDYIAPALDPATRRLPVRATVASDGGLLKPEMFADFALEARRPDEALGVPASAVIYEGDTARVWVAGQDRTLELRRIKAGRTANGEVEALSGLKPGDRVVTAGAIFIDRAAKPD